MHAELNTDFYNHETTELKPELNDVDEMENIQKNIISGLKED